MPHKKALLTLSPIGFFAHFFSVSLGFCGRNLVFMSVVRLKIDVSGTVGDQAWRELKQFDQIQSADFGPQFGSGGRCNHPLNAPHQKGEWIGAEVRLQTPLLAQYAVSHYLEQDRVLDADVIE